MANADPFVYVVEDDASVRDGLDRLMRSAGYRVRPFASAEELVASLEPGSRGCILLDLAVRGPDGRSLPERLRDRGVEMPCIALCADPGEAADAQARALGADLLLRMPVDDRALLDSIRWVVGGRTCPADGNPTRREGTR